MRIPGPLEDEDLRLNLIVAYPMHACKIAVVADHPLAIETGERESQHGSAAEAEANGRQPVRADELMAFERSHRGYHTVGEKPRIRRVEALEVGSFSGIENSNSSAVEIRCERYVTQPSQLVGPALHEVRQPPLIGNHDDTGAFLLTSAVVGEITLEPRLPLWYPTGPVTR